MTIQDEFNQLIEEAWEARMCSDPLFATSCGDHRFNHRLPAASEAGMAQWLEQLRRFLQQSQAVDSQQLDADARLNQEIFTRLLENEIAEYEFQAYRFPISKAFGIHTSLAESLPFITPFEQVADYEAYLSRLGEIPRYFSENIQVMRSGLELGYLPVRVTLEGVLEGLQQQIDAGEQSFYLLPFHQFPDSFSADECTRLAAAARAILESVVVPAEQELLKFLQDEYLPAARSEVGANLLPDGPAFYQHRIRYYTSLEMTPEQIHATGLAEVRRIRSDMDELIRRVGFQGTFSEFVEFLRSDTRFYPTSAEALLKETAYLLKRIDGELPRLFKTLPRTPYGIRTIPEASAPGATTAYYFPPTGDGRTAGFYYVNTYGLQSRALYELEALSLHEAVPGHHLQIALQQELDLPNFRRFGGFTAFVEGWALYSERLGIEMGFYQDPYSDFGRLSYEMWRACRLVVDSGMHALGWTRQQAIDYMAENTALTLLNITNEVDRYIAWPGQALAYKMGEIKIRQLRQRAEEQLGDRFDLRAFHEVVLTHGAVPLDILEDIVTQWIQSQ